MILIDKEKLKEDITTKINPTLQNMVVYIEVAKALVDVMKLIDEQDMYAVTETFSNETDTWHTVMKVKEAK